MSERGACLVRPWRDAPAASGGRVVAAAILAMAGLAAAAAEPDLDEEAAFQAAAAAVAPSVVRVEVAGVSEAGLSGPAEASPAAGPSSGLVVGADGWIVATSFAVPKDVTQAVVTLPGGGRRVARVAGRDLARGLVLLAGEGGQAQQGVQRTLAQVDVHAHEDVFDH